MGALLGVRVSRLRRWRMFLKRVTSDPLNGEHAGRQWLLWMDPGAPVYRMEGLGDSVKPWPLRGQQWKFGGESPLLSLKTPAAEGWLFLAILIGHVGTKATFQAPVPRAAAKSCRSGLDFKK